MTKQQVANLMLKDLPWDGSEMAAPLTLPGALLAPSYMEQKAIAKPSSPPAGSLRLYPKADGKYYQLDSAGNEQLISGQSQAQNDARYLQLTGGTLTGPLTATSITAQNITASGSVTADGIVANAYHWTPVTDGELLYKEMPGRLRLSGAQLTIDQNLNIGAFGQFAEIASPVTPNDGFLRLYAKGDHRLYIKITSGAEEPLLTQTLADTKYDILGVAAAGDAAHVAATDPHPVYLTAAEGDARYAVISGGPGGTYLTDVQADQRYVRQDGTKAMTADLVTTGVGSSGANNFPIKTNNVTRWFVDGTTSAYLPGTDDAYDIGSAGARPRVLTLSNSLTIGGTNNFFRVRQEPNLATAWNIEHVPTGAIGFLPANSGSFGAGIWLSYNAFFDGTNMQPLNVSSPSSYFNISASGMSMAVAAASANPALSWKWSVDTLGRVSQSGGLWIDNGGTWDGPGVSSTTPALYFGGGPAGTGEGIGSKRTAGGNQYGLDFFIGWATRMSLNTGGLNVAGSLIVNNGQTTYSHTMMSMATGGVSSTGASEGQLELQNAGSGASKIAFHRTGAYAAYFGLDTDNVWRVGGWSMGGVAYRLILGDGAPASMNGAINVGTINAGQLNNTYINTEGVDIGAGPLYFKHNASYYIQWDGGSWLQAVNMGIMSWSSFAFSANAGIYIGGWDGTWIHTSHNIMINGSSLGFGNNGGVYWSYDGWMRCYGVTGIGTSGSYYWLANNSAIGMYWDTVYLRMRPNLMTDGNNIYFAANGGISLYWQGSGIQSTHQIFAPSFVTTGSGTYNFGDTNVRISRPANIMYFYAYDAQWAFIRTTDSFNCGYVDGGGFHNTSKTSTKQDIVPLRDGLNIVTDKRVSPIRFAYKGDEVHDPIPSMGFTAEDMAEVIPEVVGYDDDGPSSINYSVLVAVLWDAIRTLNDKVEELQVKVGQA